MTTQLDSIASPAEAGSDQAASAAEGSVAGQADFLTATNLRYEWYRDGFRLTLGLLVLLGLLLAVSMALNVFLFSYRPAPRYFIQTANGDLVGVEPLNQPSFSDERVSEWATKALLAANNWNFANYREELQEACNGYFTPSGCQEYRDALIRIGNLESVKTKRLTVKAVVTKPPIFLNKVLQGQTQRFTWHLQTELVVSYLGSSEQTTQSLLVDLVVVRRPVTETEQGLGIERYIASVGRAH